MRRFSIKARSSSSSSKSSAMMHLPGHRVTTTRTRPPHHRNMQVRTPAMPPRFTVGTHCPVAYRAATCAFLGNGHIVQLMADTALTLCRCGCGTPVRNTWARGHWRRGPGGGVMAEVTPLTQEEIDSAEFDDLGLIDVPDTPDPDAPPSAPRSPFLGEGRAGAPPPPSGEVPVPDEPPAHARKRKRAPKLTDADAGKAKRPRIPVTIRADINAKVSVPLEVSGTIWAVRDPLCGGMFLQQRPAIAETLTDIICDSPDLVAFFPGPMAGYMRYL